MKMTLKLGRYGMQMEEATIVKWRKQPGDDIAPGNILYEIETEKVTQEVEAPGAGRFIEALVPEGENAQVGQAVCVVETA